MDFDVQDKDEGGGGGGVIGYQEQEGEVNLNHDDNGYCDAQ